MSRPTPTTGRIDPDRARAARRRVRAIARWLDDAFTIPGTDRRFGLDPLIGLLPGVGDVIGWALASWVLFEAWRLDTPRPLLGRMLGNVVLEALVGIVPGIGDLFDFAFKANRRNAAILDRYLETVLAPAPRASPGPAASVVLVAAVLVVLALALVGSIAVFRMLLGS